LHVHFIQRSAAGEAQRARWDSYRAIWGFVDGDGCRRVAIQRHFGDRSAPNVAEGVPCCDVCSPEALPPPPLRAAGAGARRASGSPRAPVAHAGPVPGVELDRAIVEVVVSARPAVGRTRAVEILRGGRSKVVAQNGYDSLGLYGAFAHLSNAQTLARVDQLIDRGVLRSTGGRFPKLGLGRERIAA
jgi:ATP-dependent DNA helicase RecQ